MDLNVIFGDKNFELYYYVKQDNYHYLVPKVILNDMICPIKDNKIIFCNYDNIITEIKMKQHTYCYYSDCLTYFIVNGDCFFLYNGEIKYTGIFVGGLIKSNHVKIDGGFALFYKNGPRIITNQYLIDRFHFKSIYYISHEFIGNSHYVVTDVEDTNLVLKIRGDIELILDFVKHDKKQDILYEIGSTGGDKSKNFIKSYKKFNGNCFIKYDTLRNRYSLSTDRSEVENHYKNYICGFILGIAPIIL